MLARTTPRMAADPNLVCVTHCAEPHRALAVYDTLQARDFLSHQHDMLLRSWTWLEQQEGRPVRMMNGALGERKT